MLQGKCHGLFRTDNQPNVCDITFAKLTMEIFNATQHNTTQHSSGIKNALALALGFTLSCGIANADSDFDSMYTTQEHAGFVQQAQKDAQKIIGQLKAQGSVLVDDPKELELIQADALINAYQFALNEANVKFAKADKHKLPRAPKNAAGQYYIALASPDIGISIPTTLGDAYIDVEAMRYRMVTTDLQSKRDKLVKDKRLAKALTGNVQINITKVSSSNFWNGGSGFEDVTYKTITDWDHGTQWVGFEAEIKGAAYAVPTSTICGATPSLVLYGLFGPTGAPIGWWYRASADTDCNYQNIYTQVSGQGGPVSDSITVR